ncbi:7,8-dihydro-6-hydroxymethylpterin dimethyltransferase [uncultured archaeon]|nr:7,8-dihydro-6-hydroxymethylpterin dimethyltransferase [uncultured archaeon]
MVLAISEFIGNSMLGDLRNIIPQKNDFRYRIEDFGYTIFDIETLKVILINNIGFKLLNKIDGKKQLKSILLELSKETRVPYALLVPMALNYLSFMSKTGLVKLNGSIDYKFKEHYSISPVLRGPNQISWLITNNCNLRCSHCGNTSRAKLKNEMTKEECFRFIDDCARLKVFVINISGGEPFLKKDWFEILSYARKKGIEIGITTNGTLINEDIVKKLKKLETFNVHISLDGIGKVHDEFRNKKGVYKSVLKTINLFKKYKIPFGLTTSITKKNFNDLDNVKNFIKKNRINSWNLYYALPVGCLSKADSISQEEFYEFGKKIAKYREELKEITNISVGDSMGYYGSLNLRDSFWTGCGAGLSGCSVDAEGNLKGCPIQNDKFVEGNIRKTPLKELWLKKGAFSYNREPKKLVKHCKSCKYAVYCRGGCKSSMDSNGTDFRYNDYCIYHIEKTKKFARIN